MVESVVVAGRQDGAEAIAKFSICIQLPLDP